MSFTGCPGSMMKDFRAEAQEECADEGQVQTGNIPSELRQWPIQLHLVNPAAPYFQGSDVLLAADCVAFSLGVFHPGYLKGKSLAIACPKLDSEQESYSEKITAFIDNAKINTLTVMTMQVPCCTGLLKLAKDAQSKAQRKVPVKWIVVGLQGEILSEEWA